MTTCSLASLTGRGGVGTHGADDVALRRWTDVVERIARDQRDRARRRSGRAPIRPPGRRPRPVRRGTAPCLAASRARWVTGPDVFQASEEPVAVPGDSGVAIRPRQCRTVDVTHCAVEREVVGARRDRHLEANLRDAHDRERRRCGIVRRAPPGADALGVPKAQVRCGGLCSAAGCIAAACSASGGEALEFLPGAHDTVAFQRAPRHQAHKAEHPGRAFRPHHGPPVAGGLPYRTELRTGFHSRFS